MRIRLLLPIVAMVFTGAFVAAADAQEHRGTPAQRKACRPDVWRLCAAEIPNARAITRCLERNKPRLSADCQAVFDGTLQ
jgi:hypothetical protein